MNHLIDSVELAVVLVKEIWHEQLPDGVRDLHVAGVGTEAYVTAVPTEPFCGGRWAFAALDLPATVYDLACASERAVSVCWFESGYP